MSDKLAYCLYARKSTEQDERQALSIESQIREMTDQAKRAGIDIAEIRQESYSAKSSGQRPVFSQILEDVRSGVFQGIVAWAPDRLSRNAGDLGVLVDLMDEGHLQEVRTFGQLFRNTPGEKFLLMILGSQAKLENDQRSINVKRGLKAKALKGWRPGITPLGYLNDPEGEQGERQIYLDPDRAVTIREAFKRVAGGASGRDLYHWLKEAGFRTRQGRPMALSAIYRMLRDSYYCGRFEYPVGSDSWYSVNHESIVSKDLFMRVQEKLTVTPKGRPGTKEFNFTRILKCGACGAGITAEEKFKSLKDGGRRRYVYYRCTNGVNRRCSEPAVREEELLEQLLEIMERLPLKAIKLKAHFELEIDRYQRLTKAILARESNLELKKVRLNTRTYAKYLLAEGNRDDKRSVLLSIDRTLALKERRVSVTG